MDEKWAEELLNVIAVSINEEVKNNFFFILGIFCLDISVSGIET